MTSPVEMGPEELRYAGLGRRFCALVADFLVFCAVFFPVTRLVKGVWLMTAEQHDWTWGQIAFDPLCLIFLAIISLYFILLEAWLGRTIGKRIFGLCVVRAEGGRPGLGRSLARNLLRLVDGLPAFSILGAMLILLTPQRTRIGDLGASTRVICR